MMRRAALAMALLMLPLPAPAQEAEALVRGPVRPQRLAALGPQADGVVREVPVVEGMRVQRGAILVRLADELQAARIGLARAAAEAEGELRQAQIHHAEAAAVLLRTQQAAGRGAATEWEVRQARARLEVARAVEDAATERRRVEQRRLELELAAQEQLVIRAPFDGLVSRLDTVPGATLLRTDRPVTVADLALLEAVLYVPAAAWPLLRPGASYALQLSDPVGRSVMAQLRHVDPVMDAASGRFRTVFLIENADGVLPAGIEAALDLSGLPR